MFRSRLLVSLDRGSRIVPTVGRLVQEREVGSVVQFLLDFISPGAGQECPVHILLEDRLVLGIQETIVKLQVVVPIFLPLGPVGVSPYDGVQRVVVVTAGRPAGETGLGEVQCSFQSVGPIDRLRWSHDGLRSIRQQLGRLGRRSLRIFLGFVILGKRLPT